MNCGPLVLIGIGIVLSVGHVPLWSTLLSVAILVATVLLTAEPQEVRRG